MNQKRYKAKGPTPEKNESHKTHPPFCGDGPRDPTYGQRGGPRVAFWPNPSALREYSVGTGRADNPVSSAGATGSSTSQTGSQ